ncbi:Resolvase/integrase Bin [Klebsiella pneumoniae IS39]|nr:Resolvase/integrase Bin [Klebsiella pneumoniae IS39]
MNKTKGCLIANFATVPTIPIDSSMIYNYDNYRIIVIIVNITN